MTTQSLAPGNRTGGFIVDTVEQLPELRCTALLLTHERTGARLVHIRNDDPNNLFCCAFRTPVFNNTGVPHILEHSVLGGSARFPVKDPFQQILKCSLQTFLNALTYPDKTLYPVASQVEQDYYNLVDVYCDAVFHPLLTERTFAQEGWHFDVEAPGAPVNIKGIVYNEMKGVFSDFRSHVGRKTLSALFPDTTYFFESGGEPAHIPELSYEQFKEFHARYYHPSNSFIYLYGAQDTARTCAFLDTHYLKAFEKITIDSRVTPQSAWSAPRESIIEAPAPREDAGSASVNLCWIFGSSTDPLNVFCGNVLARYLLGTENSPLRRALIDSGLGEDLDDLSGFDSDCMQSMFCAGLRKATAENAHTIRDLILTTLQAQVQSGLDGQLLEGVLRQAEFSLREVADSGRWPYSLKLGERIYRSWIYDGDPLAHLRFQRTLDAVRNAPPLTLFTSLIRERLLENPHRILSVVKASPELGEKLQHETEEQAARLSADFSAETRERCRRLTGELLDEQKRQPSAEELACLPRIARADLPKRGIETPTESSVDGTMRIFQHALFCGGISYCDIGFDCSTVPAKLVPYLPLYSELLTRCGAGDYSYQQMANRIALTTGGIEASILLDHTHGEQRGREFRLIVHAKCIRERFSEMLPVLGDIFVAPILNDIKLVSDIVLEMRNDLNASVLGSGHTFASQYASARLDPLRRDADILDGIEQLRFLDRLVHEAAPKKTIARLQELHSHVVSHQGAFISITSDSPDSHIGPTRELLRSLPLRSASTSAQHVWTPNPALIGIEISSSVNYVAKAWLLPLLEPAVLGQFAVLSANLSRGYLWDKVRVEGGAYGAFASLASTYPVFTCASYRDPNLARTVGVFDSAIAFACDAIMDSMVDESVVSTIGQIDKPRTPHARGYGETIALLLGRSPQYRQALRESVLTATAARVREAASMLSGAKQSAITALGSAAALNGATAEGLRIDREELLTAPTAR